MKISDIINTNEAIVYEPDTSEEIYSITTEPSGIKENCLYILENKDKLPNFSSLPLLPKAIITDTDSNFPEEIKVIRVENARYASAIAHSRFYGVNYEKIKIIGVTGTNGKTSVATMIYRILNDNGIKTGFIGTGRIEIPGKRLNDQYYSMTTPPPEKLYPIVKRMQDEGCVYIVIEVSSHAMSQNRVAAIPFEYGVFTNLSPAHLDYHRDTEDYYVAKRKLLEQAKKAVINIDDTYGRRASKELEGTVLSIGALWRGDAYATEIEDFGFDGVSYFYHEKNFHYKSVLKLCGAYNVYNSMLAAKTCIDIGIAPCKVKASISKLEAIEGRYEIIKDKITVIIDYAHTSEGFASLLQSLNKSKKHGKLTVVFGCGGERDPSSRPKMASIAEKFADKILLTADNPRREPISNIFADIISGFQNKRYEIYENRADAIQNAISYANPGDVVAIIGKGCEEYFIDENGYHNFSDKETAIAALNKTKTVKL